jgi:hypothetical protein
MGRAPAAEKISVMRSRRLVRAMVIGWGAVATSVATAGAQQQPPQEQGIKIGGRVGYNIETDERLFSGTLSVPMNSRVEFYPSVDIYTPERGSKIGFNGDLKIHFKDKVPFLYTGIGFGVISSTFTDSSHTAMGANLLLGAEPSRGWLRPFVEGRVVMRDQAQVQVIAGLNLLHGGR